MKIHFLAFFILSFSITASATTEVEEEKLKQVVAEIDFLSNLVLEAKGFSSESDPKKFEYEKLIFNLSEIRAAIDRHINKKSTAPRKVKELLIMKDS